MSRFLLLVPIAIAFLAETLIARPAVASDFFVFPVKLSLPIHDVVAGGVVKKTLKEKDLVNLALGRPLGTKLDKEREVLAVAVARFPEDAEKARLIVFDPSQNGLAQITTEVAEPIDIDREVALLANGKQGHGVMTGRAVETDPALGDPSKNALHSTIGWVSGNGKSKLELKGGSFKGVVAGRASITVTESGQTTAFSGFVVNGKVKVSGKLLGMFSDGDTDPPGCGDGIIQPGLGEECEFNMQAACPGDCDQCICAVCGNNRRDRGEICDGTDKDICDALGFSVGCKATCSGCHQCGDGIVAPGEECDPNLLNQCPGSQCLFPNCVCGCTPGVLGTCPGNECCDPATKRCCVPGTVGCGLNPESCCGGTVSGGMCAGLVPPGGMCPDRPNACFICRACDGKQITGECPISPTGVCTWDDPP